MDKELLFKRKASAQTAAVPIDDLGEVVVRALSEGEVREAREGKPADDVYQRRLMAKALVDPVMTFEEVCLWLDGDPDDPDDDGAPAGDSVKVMTVVTELSGLAEGAQKSGPAGVRKRRRR